MLPRLVSHSMLVWLAKHKVAIIIASIERKNNEQRRGRGIRLVDMTEKKVKPDLNQTK